MKLSTRPNILRINGSHHAPLNEFAIDVLTGLSQENKMLPSKYLYDTNGSELFKKITDLEEYYPTRIEFEILEGAKQTLLQRYLQKPTFNFVEFGSGDGRKTKILLKYFIENHLNFEYYPLDISYSALEELLSNLKDELKDLKSTGLSGDYFEGIKRLSQLNEYPNFILFLGSNIGNFNPDEATFFMLNLWETLSRGDMVLIGFDLVKDEKILQNAYDDSNGITAQFNLNLLERINRELEANFDLTKFSHYPFYDPVLQVMKSYLLSREEQEVTINRLRKKFHFDFMEPIFTENSYKYSIEKINKLAAQTGFKVMEIFKDEKAYFSDVLLKCVK